MTYPPRNAPNGLDGVTTASGLAVFGDAEKNLAGGAARVANSLVERAGDALLSSDAENLEVMV